MSMAGHHHHPKPDIYMGPMYTKPGVVSAHDIMDLRMRAATEYEQGVDYDVPNMGESRGRGV